MEEKTNQANAIEENAAKEFEQAMNEATPEDRKKAIEELRKKYKEQIEERKAKNKEAQAAMSEGKGRLKLETPIRAGDEEIEELIYDFNELTGIEYTDAMDSDINAQQIYRITYRQALEERAAMLGGHVVFHGDNGFRIFVSIPKRKGEDIDD